MKNSLSLILLLYPALASAGPRSIASMDTPVTPTFIDCIKSLSAVSTTPPFPKMYFQTLAGKEVFALRCHMKDQKENMRFAILDSNGLRSLKLPIYYYKFVYKDGSTDSTDLPRNVVHFKTQDKDHYFQLMYSDVAKIFGPEAIPEVAKEMLVTTSRIQNEYIKKYETWLKSRGEDKAIFLTDAGAEEATYLEPCFEAKAKEISGLYLQGRFLKLIPPYGVIFEDTRNYANLSAAAKEKYQRPWSEIEADVLKDISEGHPFCEGIVSETMVKANFDKFWDKNKAPYEALHRYYFGK